MVTRPTATVTITIDAHSDLVAEAAALRAEEKRLALAAARTGDGEDPRVPEIQARLAELEQHPCRQTGWWSGPFHRAPRACAPAVLSS